MSRPLNPALALAATVLAVLAFSACGSSSHTIPSNAVALVGETPITKATLNHWMHSMAGGDFWERFEKRAPANLAAEPEDIPSCEVAARALVAEKKGNRKFTPAELTARCRQLYLALREQALTFLIGVQWRINEGKEHGVSVSDAQASRYSAQYVSQFYPKPGEYEAYLANREWAPSDELYQVKRNLLTTKLREKISGVEPGHKETPQSMIAYISFVKKHLAQRTAETRCRASYAISMCRGHKELAALSRSPILILEELLGRQ